MASLSSSSSFENLRDGPLHSEEIPEFTVVKDDLKSPEDDSFYQKLIEENTRLKLTLEEMKIKIQEEETSNIKYNKRMNELEKIMFERYAALFGKIVKIESWISKQKVAKQTASYMDQFKNRE